MAQPMIATCGVLIDATVSTILLPNHFGEAFMEVDMEIVAWLIVLVFFVGVVVFSLS